MLSRRFPFFFAVSMALSIGLSLFAADRAHAQSQELCGDTYKIVRGDTLSILARRVYGRSDAFLRFYEDERNARSLGDNPNRISVGDILYLPPCPGEEVALEPTPKQDGQIDEFAPSIDIVTATDYAPFTDEKMRDRGMLTKVVSEAFAQSGLNREVRIDFINDWGSHLDPLMKEAKYDYGFPWFKPDCTDPAALSESMRVRCDFVWSDPLFSVTIGFYSLATARDLPESFDDLRGKRLCRPSGYFTFDLEEKNLIPGESIKLAQPNGVLDCFEMLRDGKVDIVTINRFTAEQAIAEAGLEGLISPIQTIVTTQDLHLITHKSNSDAVRDMRAFNEGLRKIKSEGRFNRIVQVFLAIQEERIEKIRRGDN